MENRDEERGDQRNEDGRHDCPSKAKPKVICYMATLFYYFVSCLILTLYKALDIEKTHLFDKAYRQNIV